MQIIAIDNKGVAQIIEAEDFSRIIYDVDGTDEGYLEISYGAMISQWVKKEAKNGREINADMRKYLKLDDTGKPTFQELSNQS